MERPKALSGHLRRPRSPHRAVRAAPSSRTRADKHDLGNPGATVNHFSPDGNGLKNGRYF